MKVVGLYGYGGVGKDEVGRILIENHGFTRFSKGDLIKEAAWRIDPIIRGLGTEHDRLKTLSWNHGGFHYQTPTEKIDQLKDIYPEVRFFLQHLADDVVSVLGRDVWNEALWESIERHHADSFILRTERPVVLTRLSLPVEADQLGENGGTLVRVIRAGFGPANTHPNEVALDTYDPDAVVVNNGTLEDLEAEVAKLVKELW